jgi:2-keto-4-pentenoate hydratase/2-oxohepta-3-ene-1,7-dioic acid hydratase in catechol pathway
MRLGTVALEDGRRAVVAGGADGRVHDVTPQLGDDLAAALGDGRAAGLRDPGEGTELEPAAFRWLPPIPAPRRILLAGFNFRSHANESAREVPAHPTFFVRFPSSFVGHGEPILRPPESDTLDWEGEIAVVIGRGGRRIPAEGALEHVAGYAPLADNSVRDFQLHSSQATAGKNFDRSGSWGPWLITPDEAGDPADLEVRTLLNGDEVQHGRLRDLLFTVPDLIAYASTFTALQPGDIIAAGTPQGIGLRRSPPVFLRPGDELTVEMVGHTGLTNTVADDAVAA